MSPFAPFPPPAVKEATICEKCQSIDLAQGAKALSGLDDGKGHLVAIVDWLSPSSCTFCKALRCTIDSLLHSGLWVFKDESVYELRALSLYRLESDTNYGPDNVVLRVTLPDDTMMLQLVPIGLSVDKVRFSFLDLIFRHVLARPSSAEPKCFQPSIISPDVDFSLVRKWLEKCQQFHGETCSSSEVPTDLILIDCVALELRTFQSPPPYIALSYVWAKTNLSSSKPILYDCFPPPNGLSKVIEDSISVTKQLGFQYFWVDKYCVNQLDEEEKARTIDSMDLIYNWAELTIIAAAGEDEHHGLPGVSFSREPGSVFSIGDFTIICEPMNPDYLMSGSKWPRRGWTYQEYVLSRRRLFFLDQQISFKCAEMSCWESRSGVELCPNDEYSVEDYACWSRKKLRSIFLPVFDRLGSKASSWVDRLREINALIAVYNNGRELTFDSDTLRAFAGLQRACQDGKYPFGFIQGLPIPLHSSSSLEDWAVVVSFGLCWQPKGLPRRRNLFPSWTWADWSHFLCMESVPNRDMVKSYVEDIVFGFDDERKVSLVEIIEMIRQNMQTRSFKFSQPKIISLHTRLAARELFSFTDDSNWLSGRYSDVPICTDSQEPSWNDPVLSFSPSHFLQCLKNESMACLILAASHHQEFRVHLLLVQWIRPGEAHRVGKLALWDKSERLPQLEEHINSLPMIPVTLR